LTSERERMELKEAVSEMPKPASLRANAVPPPIGSTPREPSREPSSDRRENGFRITEAPAPAPVSAPLRTPNSSSADDSSGIQKAVSAFRMILPIVQRVLPLLEGNLGTAIVSLLAPRAHSQPAPPKIDLVPIERGLAALQSQHAVLRDQLLDQNTSLKRVEDQLEGVREVANRTSLQQQELLEDLKAFRSKIKFVAAVGITLLAIGFVLELLIFLHLRHVPLR
jgi:hypothetical protein